MRYILFVCEQCGECPRGDDLGRERILGSGEYGFIPMGDEIR